MSGFVLIRADPAGTLLGDDPIVRRGDVPRLRDADELLASVTALRDDAGRASQNAAREARAAGYEAGRAEGIAAGAEAIRAELLRLAQADAVRTEQQRGDLARLGLEVVRRIAADLGPVELVAALAEKAAAAISPEIQLLVRVPTAAVERTRARLAAHASVEADETLADTECVLVTPLGEVRAGLDIQLSQLAKQWGLA